jgi:hypothetical protein
MVLLYTSPPAQPSGAEGYMIRLGAGRARHSRP